MTFGVLDELIRNQVSQYLPYIGINSINFATSEASADLDPNFMGITISFTILPLQVSTFLQINADES